MESIFISYRREESSGHAGRVYDKLRERFGRDRVFMDVSAIEPGVDFVEAIDRAVGTCAVLLVVIGRMWLDCSDATGRRRLDDPQDFIRLEVGAALRRNIRVVPVLVQDAAMPAETQLPDDLKLLARRNAIEINDTHWDTDLAQLVETVGRVLDGCTEAAQSAGTATASSSPPARRNRLVWLISSATAVVAALTGLLTGVESLRNGVVRLFGGSPPAATAPAPPSPSPTASTGQTTVKPAASTMPSVLGMEEQQAIAAIRGGGLEAQVERRVSPDERPGTVFRQEPAAGASLPATSGVLIVVAKAPEQPKEPPAPGKKEPQKTKIVAVPDLGGQSVQEARAALGRAGLAAGETQERETRDAVSGTVIDQSPKAGTKLTRGNKISLVVAVKPPEPELATVPNVVRQPLENAVRMLTNAGLQPGAVTRRQSEQARPGTVLDQRIKGGATAKRGTRVDLLVASQPPPGGGTQEKMPQKPKIIAKGKLEIPQTYQFDLDSGKLARDGDADLWFDAVTDTERYLTPRNGATIGFVRESEDGYDKCAQAKLTDRRITIQRIPPNGLACVRTTRGNLSYFKLRETVGPSPGVLKIDYITWESVR